MNFTGTRSRQWYILNNVKKTFQCEVKMNVRYSMRQRMLSCSFTPDRETGACCELMNHISIINKKQWKRKSDIRKQWNLRQRESFVRGLTQHFRCCGQCLLVNSAPSCPGTALWHPLWHQDKGAAFNTALPPRGQFFLCQPRSNCQPFLYNLDTVGVEESTTETESRQTDREVNLTLYSDCGQGNRLS